MFTLRNNLKFKHVFSFFPKFNFAQASQKMPVLDDKANTQGSLTTSETKIQPWIDVENRLTRLRGELVLSEQDKIEKYVLGVIKGYFRTTYKDGITLESELTNHGLDSLDSIELCMILEDELGYIIEAETMPKLTKVKHFVNFIKQMEAYKREFVIFPQERAQKDEENWDDWIPKGEDLKNKLYSFTKKNKENAAHKSTANKGDNRLKKKVGETAEKEEKVKH
jgi:acyl carrier protein